MRLVKVFRQRELQGTLRITNEFNDCVQKQIISLRNGVILSLWNMTGEYHNKHFILFSIADQISVEVLQYL
jgi:hypothetical protein